MRDLFSNVVVQTVWDPVDLGSGDTPKVGAVIDHQGYDSALYHIAYGSIADTDVTFTTLLEESDASGSGFAAVADADLLGTEAGATPLLTNDNTGFKIGYRGNKRYTRLTLTPADNTGAILTSAVVILGKPSIAPLTTQAV